MRTKKLTAVNVFCENHKIEISFVKSLQATGLIDIKIVDKINYIDSEQLQKLEKIMLFYYDLEINIEGIETINHLLQRINSMQNEIMILKNRLNFYDTNELNQS